MTDTRTNEELLRWLIVPLIAGCDANHPDMLAIRAAVLARMTPGWKPIASAPRNGDKFWCPRPNGKEILLVERFDSVALHSGIPNAVIHGATGKWWKPAVWMPYEALAPSPSQQGEKA